MHSSTTARSGLSWAMRPMPRRRRRALVVAIYVSFAAFMVAMYAGYTAAPRWPTWLAVLAIVLFAATAAGFIRLVTAPGYAADTVDRRLDERQRQIRDRAYRSAYYALTVLFGALTLGVMYAAAIEEIWAGARDAALLLPWLTFLPGSLPTAVVAWGEPDPPTDD